MNLLIPTILLIACILIIRYMVKESKPVEVIQEVELSEEDMFIIEEKMKRDMLFCANWWKIQGRFNTAQYVKYLEYKASKV
jgi:hypothetical protein